MSKVDKALNTMGWTSKEELIYLETIANNKELVIEFGSWCGRSSLVLSFAKKVVCVDIWSINKSDALQELITQTGKTHEQHFDLTMRDIPNFVKEKGDLNNSDFCDYLVSKYGKLADVVFIDADHKEQSVINNIILARKLLKPDGILCGHDYHISWPGVVKAVDVLVNKIIVADSFWQER